MTYADLIAAVRAQIDVSDDQAYEWILDRARVLNAETDWLVEQTSWGATDPGADTYPLPDGLVKVEAITVGTLPFKRSTPGGVDVARDTNQRSPVYAESWDAAGAHYLQLWPPPSAPAIVVMRFLSDVPDNRGGSPPFPTDLQGVLADGAIAVGLARMDERFDSAGYFDAKFADGIQRLKRRRHGHVGRGGTPIRLVG
jgi:hypothetical protein